MEISAEKLVYAEWLCQFSKLTRKPAVEEIKKYVHWYNNERIQNIF